MMYFNIINSKRVIAMHQGYLAEILEDSLEKIRSTVFITFFFDSISRKPDLS